MIRAVASAVSIFRWNRSPLDMLRSTRAGLDGGRCWACLSSGWGVGVGAVVAIDVGILTPASMFRGLNHDLCPGRGVPRCVCRRVRFLANPLWSNCCRGAASAAGITAGSSGRIPRRHECCGDRTGPGPPPFFNFFNSSAGLKMWIGGCTKFAKWPQLARL